MHQRGTSLVKAIAMLGASLLLFWPLGGRVVAQTTAANAVAYFTAIGVCLKEEGYATGEQSTEVVMEMTRSYARANNIGWDRLKRIATESSFRAKMLDVISKSGGCALLLEAWKRP